MYHVYILWSEKGCCLYKGVTEDVQERLKQHNNGESKWTKRHSGTWEIVWQRTFPTLGDARKFEIRLKKQRGGNGFWHLTGLDPHDFKGLAGS